MTGEVGKARQNHQPGKIGRLLQIIHLKRTFLKVLSVFLMGYNFGETFDRDRDYDPDKCKTIRPYKKCTSIPMKLTEAYFDLPVGSLIKLGCFTDDMGSVCGDFGLCMRTKRYAIRRGVTD